MVERDKTLICEDNGGDADDLVSQGAGEQWHWKPSPTAVAGWELFILDRMEMIIERRPGTLCAAKYKTALTAETLCKDCGRPFTTKCLLQVTIILMIIFVRLLGMGGFHYQVHVGCHEDHLVSKTKKYQTMTKCNFQVCRKSDEILCTICGKELSCKCLLNVSSDRWRTQLYNCNDRANDNDDYF